MIALREIVAEVVVLAAKKAKLKVPAWRAEQIRRWRAVREYERIEKEIGYRAAGPRER